MRRNPVPVSQPFKMFQTSHTENGLCFCIIAMERHVLTTVAGNHFRPRDATGSAIPCSGNGASGGLLANTCTNGSVCLISTNDCTQVASPAQAQSGQGSDACFASCQPGSCYTAAYTKEGRCLIFARDCCSTAP